jgi:hypothetical protein
MAAMARRMAAMATRGRGAGLLLLAGLTLAGGCAGPFVSAIAPPPYRDQLPASYDVTWRALVQALAADNLPIRVVAKDSGVISSDDFLSPIGVYADCGRIGDVQLEGEAVLAFTVFLRANGREATDVQINSKMRTRMHRRGDSGKLRSKPIYPCVSTGRWESDLMDTLRRLIRE